MNIMNMFCYQCQQTSGGTGCTVGGVCGKDAKAAALQDLLTAWAKQIAQMRTTYREKGHSSRVIDRFLLEALFVTITNVNFDHQELARLICLADRILRLADYLATEKEVPYQKSLEDEVLAPIDALDAAQIDELETQGKDCAISIRQNDLGPVVTGLQELILYGIRGTAAYTWHFYDTGLRTRESLRLEIEGMKRRVKELRSRDSKEKEKKERLQKEIRATDELIVDWEEKETTLLDGLFAELAALLDEPSDLEVLLASALKVGELNLTAMELLERFHHALFGVPEPTVVRTTPVAGKSILVSGHDLNDLAELLRQTEGKGINVYTHGEMLPAHAYPRLKKFAHLAGHFGTAWQNQQSEFDSFPGAILMTTNCIQKPRESYFDYIFTTGPVAWPGVKHIPTGPDGRKDFSPLIQAALDSSGYMKSKPTEKITIGFGADAVVKISDQIFRAIDRGDLKRFFLIGGCDGSQEKRSYFTELAEKVPEDCVILTLGCGKYRFNSMKFQPLANALPRLWDMGQCNDAWSAIRLLLFLSQQTGKGVNDLPISIFLSWFEQKAVAVLLSLLYLDVKNIRLGPSLPAFIAPEAVAVLSEKFGLRPISDDPQTDLDAIFPPNG